MAEPKRFPIPSAQIAHEIGSCYIATMDCGEDGDSESNGKSTLLLFEDGKPLGPAHCLHADIREKGQGRYSHWTHNGLYLSASDNSNPATNGRKYEVASTNPDNSLAGLGDVGAPPKRHTEVLRSSHQEYQVVMGGNLDFENAHTRHNDTFAIAFQPNLSLTIENTGAVTVAWPKVIANDRGDWGTYDSLLAEFTRGATSDQEKALFIWQTARENRYHSSPLFADAEFHDPVKMFNSYGLNLCDDLGYCGCSLFKHAGLGKPKYKLDPKVRCLNGHMQCEAVVGNDYQFLDIDESVFHLDRENERIVSGDACARDHDLVRREVHYGPVFGGWGGSEGNAALFGADDGETAGFLRGHTMRYSLRPGEKVVFRWDNIGKWAAQSKEWDHRPCFFGNSKFIYRPRLDAEHRSEGVKAESGIVPATVPGAVLAGAGAEAQLTYAFDIPWAICGGTVRAEFAGLGETDRFALDVTVDDKTLTRVWEGKGPGPVVATVPIDQALNVRVSPAKYHYAVIVRLASGSDRHGANLKALEFETDVMAAPLSLPRLQRGENRLVYSDETEAAHEITVTHEWQECHRITPPSAPAAPEYPAPAAAIRDSIVTFKWPEVARCSAYHLQVSLRPDFRIPYRVSYDVIVNTNRWCVPYTGMFSPDTTYYWRLRARSRQGVWSEWSPAWTFKWQGPRVPLNVRPEIGDGTIVLRWDPNPRGARPVAYDVYGSDEKGFSVHKTEYDSYGRGKVPANYLGRTAETAMPVVVPNPTHANMNRCFYRVVAIDADGTESICSDFAEMPHPFFWTRPPATGGAGTPFVYELKVLASLGDCQHLGDPAVNKFWDTEQTKFALRQGPAWLKIDAATGRLTGTPDAKGKVHVEIEATNQFKGQAIQAFDVVVE